MINILLSLKSVIIGVLGLSIIILIHELGHFVMARIFKVHVEIFSIGFGKKLVKKRVGETEFCFSAIPLGGYCKMEGEFYPTESAESKPAAGSLYSLSPLGRMVIAFGGPLFNILAAILLFGFLAWVGHTEYRLSNRVVIAHQEGELMPAEQAGVIDGDRVVAINGKEVTSFDQISRIVMFSGDSENLFTIDRNGTLFDVSITPNFDRETGISRIGIYSWIDPTIEAPQEWELFGFKRGDRVLSLNSVAVRNHIELLNVIRNSAEPFLFEIEREGQVLTIEADQLPKESLPLFRVESYEVAYRNPFTALTIGTKRAFDTFSVSLKSFRLLFKGVSPKNTLMGPLRIPYITGEEIASGFQEGLWSGIRNFLSLAAFLGTLLAFMNLLPIPALDGGLILLNLFEIAFSLFHRKIPQKIVQGYITFGTILIIGIAIFALTNDILFFATK